MLIEKISYSSLSDFHYCGRFFKLTHIDKLNPKKSTPDTHFGTLVHRYCQSVLNESLQPKEASEKFLKIWNKLFSMFKIEEKYKHYGTVGEKIILYVQTAIKKEFGNIKVLHIEYPIMQKLDNFDQNFKGFIDIIFQLESGKTIIADFKTANSVFFFEKYRDAYKDYQITLYKRFYAKLEDISPEDIETYFIILEKDPESKKPISIIRVTSGNKKLENAEKWLTESLKSINKEKFHKDLRSCKKFGEDHPCIFYKKQCK